MVYRKWFVYVEKKIPYSAAFPSLFGALAPLSVEVVWDNARWCKISGYLPYKRLGCH